MAELMDSLALSSIPTIVAALFMSLIAEGAKEGS